MHSSSLEACEMEINTNLGLVIEEPFLTWQRCNVTASAPYLALEKDEAFSAGIHRMEAL